MRLLPEAEGECQEDFPASRFAWLPFWLLPAVLLAFHFAMGNGYGFHRDELQFLSDARRLDWGYVAYPPLTAWYGRAAVALFGISPGVFRLPAALANGITLVLAAWLARVLGGGRVAQLLTAGSVFPLALVFSTLMQYNTFDLLAWTLVVVFTARVLRTGDERNWLGAGLGVGLGVLSKYSIAFPVVSLLAGLLLLPEARKHFRSRMFWYGALLAVVVAAPNLLWLLRHEAITLRMEQFIHARDVRLGRADTYWLDQLRYTLLALPLALLGLLALLRSRRYRLLAVFFLGPLLLLALARGRGYYLLPGYTVLYAAAMVSVERWLPHRSRGVRLLTVSVIVLALCVDTAAISLMYLPVFSPESAAWNWQMQHNDDLANEVGWQDFVAQVARARETLAAADRSHMAILAGNYGEAGALELYGPRYGLPAPISTVNSFHQRGWGPFEPQTVIVVGETLQEGQRSFSNCAVAATVVLPFHVHNEETDDHPQILVCHQLKGAWPTVWAKAQSFG